MATEAREAPSGAVATRKQNHIEKLMTSEAARAYIEPFLPEGTDIARAAASVMLAIKKDETGKLKECTPESLILGVARIMQWGLELGVTAHLIPFSGQAVPVADYKGLCELMVASRAVRHVEAREVREGDSFDYRFGLDAKLVHQPVGNGKSRTARPITHVYVVLHLPFGRTAFDVMTADEVEEIRQQHSKQWKKGPLPGWYARKTIIRRIAKTLPKSPELARLFAAIAQDETPVETQDQLTAPPEPQRVAGVGDETDEFPGAFQDDRGLPE